MRIWLKPDVLARLGLTVTDVADRHPRAERGQPGRPDRRRAGAARPAVHLHGARPGTARHARGVRRHRRARQPRRLAACACRTWRGSSWARHLPAGRLLQRQAGARHRGRSRLRARTRSRSPTACAPTMDELKQRFPRGHGLRGLARHHRRPSRRASTRSCRRCSRRSLLVVLVVFIFLQSWRATLIPLLTVPVSLIGAFAVVPAARLLDQHALAVRAGAGHRPGGRRRDRRGRGGRAPHRAGAVAARGDAQGDVRGARRRSSASPSSWPRCSCRSPS